MDEFKKVVLYGGAGCAFCKQLIEALMTRVCVPFEGKPAADPENYAYLARNKTPPLAIPVLEVEGKFYKARDLFPNGKMIPVFREEAPEGYEGLILAEIIVGEL